jgi:tetratricopeptide (TPR) repeat protein
MDKKLLKKLNPILKEANNYKNQKNYEDAVRKFREGISFIRLNIKEYEEREQEVDNLLAEIDKTYSEQISDINNNVNQLIKEKNFNDALKSLDEAIQFSNKIKNANLKDLEREKIEFLINATKIHDLINQGITAKKAQQFDNTLGILQKALNKANEIYSSDPENLVIINITTLINESYLGKIKAMVSQANELHKTGKTEEAIKVYQEVIKICDNLLDLEQKRSEILNIQTSINQIYSENLNPMLLKGRDLLDQSSIDNAITELKKAEKIANMMFDSKEKSEIIKKLGTLMNPVFAERIIPIKEKGLNFIKEENYEEKTNIVTDAALTFKNGLDIAQQMIDSEEKANIIKELSELIDTTCSAGINVRKKRGRHLIEEKKFEEAVGEMYSALSIAKNMACEEIDNKEIEDIKFIVNQMYSSQIAEILEKGKILLNQKKNEEALEVFNEALGISNKMYVSDEMDEEIRKINELLREAEIKKLVSEGSLMIQQKKFTKELEELQKSLEDADKITDLERKTRKIREVKGLIDQVHSKEIKYKKEQALLLAERGQYNEAYIQFDEALKIAELIDKDELKNNEKTEIIKLYTEELNNEAKLELDNQKFDKVINVCKHAIDLNDNFSKSYYNMGNAYLGKKENEVAIKNYQRAVELNPEYGDAWSNMGLAYELLNEFDKALKFLNNAIDIDKADAITWYRMGNVYKQINNSDKAIESYKTATELNPELANAWLFLGSLYHDKKDYNAALEHIKKAAKLNSTFNDEVGSFIEEFDKLTNSLQDKLIELFKNKQDKF